MDRNSPQEPHILSFDSNIGWSPQPSILNEYPNTVLAQIVVLVLSLLVMSLLVLVVSLLVLVVSLLVVSLLVLVVSLLVVSQLVLVVSLLVLIVV
jgi:hypothetical protein